MLTMLSYRGSANENYTKIQPHPSQVGHHKKTTNVGMDLGEKRNPHTLLVRMKATKTTTEINVEIHQKAKT
jgi:hypothetical protein